MMKKLTIIIDTEGYQLLAEDELGLLNQQEWMLNTPPFSELKAGVPWEEMKMSARCVEALDRVTVASSKLTRKLGAGDYGTINKIKIEITAGEIHADISAGQSEKTICHYDWDENGQLNELQCLEGDLSLLTQPLLGDLKEASFGRYGLLARLIDQNDKPAAVMDDRGAMRWA